MPGKLRLSLKPSKQLLWLWRETRASRGRALGIDAGCGLMQNRMLFETADYVGIDVDAERLEANRKRFPGVRTVCAEIEAATKAVALRPDYFFGHQLLAMSCAQLGQTARARAAFLDAQRLNPNFDLAFAKATAPILDPADLEHELEGLRKAGWEI